MTLRSQLVADGLYSFALRVGNMLLAAVLGILSARVLGPHGRGIYALPMVNAGLVGAGFAGLTSAVSFYLLRKEAGRGVLRPTFISALLVFAVGAAATPLIAYAAHAPWSAVPALLSLPAPICMMIGSGYAIGTKRIRLVTNFSTANTVIAILFMICAFVMIGRVPAAAIASWIVSGDLFGLAIIAWVVWDARRLPPSSVSLREYLWYALRSGSVNFISLLNYRADIYIVAILGDARMLGMYSIAVTAADTLLTATQVTAMVASPHIGSMEEQQAAQLVARSVRHNVLVAGVCSLALAVVAPYAVSLLYGPAFLPMVPALRVLLIGVFALSLGSPMSTYFTLRLGRPEVALVLASFSAAICIIVTWVLVPQLGPRGRGHRFDPGVYDQPRPLRSSISASFRASTRRRCSFLKRATYPVIFSF